MLAKMLLHQLEDSAAINIDLVGLRTNAVTLMVALCGKRETFKRKAARKTVKPRKTAEPQQTGVRDESPPPDNFPLLMGKSRCPYCIGCSSMSSEERTLRYCRPAVMNDHFDREHLRPMTRAAQKGSITCQHPKCQRDGHSLKLVSMNHFRNDVQTIHGV